MNFHTSGENIYLDGHCAVLHANLRNVEGNLVEAEIDLNQILGNNWGNFAWGGTGFADSAQNIHFGLEGDQGVPVLRAELNDGQGNFVPKDVNLAERLGNDNGTFSFELETGEVVDENQHHQC